MSPNDALDTDFAAKCPELTKGCWPAWWYHTTLRLQKDGILGLVKVDWVLPTTQGRDYYEYVHLAECACFILCMCLGPMGMSKTRNGKHSHRSHTNWRPEGTQK